MKNLIGPKSEFSLGESILSVKEIALRAAQYGCKTVAVADTHSISCIPSFTKACAEYKVTPIYGCTIDVVDDLTWRRAKRGEPKKSPEKFWRATLYVKNEGGLQDLMGLLSLANDEDHFYFKPRIELSELIEVLRKGNLVFTTGSAHTVFAHPDCNSILDKLVEIALINRDVLLMFELPIVASPYYLSVCHRVGIQLDRIYGNVHAIDMEANNIMPLTTYPSLYQSDEDIFYDSRNTLDCILSRNKINSKWRNEPSKLLGLANIEDRDREFHKIYKENMKLRGGLKDESDWDTIIRFGRATAEFFNDNFEYVWHPMKVSLPNMSPHPTKTLVEKCKEGWKNRVNNEVLGYKPPKSKLPEYSDRLKYELQTLRNMGFENYFLLVESLTTWCKEQGIIVGPGRGSVGGSLVAFLLGITDVDPIRFGLIFERFINPERLDLPDIDLDFMSSRREDVIEHLRKEFGDEYVAGISNYVYLGAASSMRQVGSAFGLEPDELSASKTVPKEHGQPVTLTEAIYRSAEIEKFSTDNPEIMAHALALESRLRGYGKHAAGIVVSGVPIKERAALENRQGARIINWDKRVVEDFGLVKLDVLGLSTLDILSIAKEKIEKKHGITISYNDIPLDDEKVLKAFGEGDTVGVFQFESGGMRNLLMELAYAGPLDFEEVAAVTALYRPGPLEAGLTELYVEIRQGAAFPDYVHPMAEPALKETNSVMVYQEQTMQIARDLAGFSMSEADILRKAMGKKDTKLMAAQREKFVEGCIKNSKLEKKVADDLFSEIEEFAGYAFNKSHSIEYTIISYWNMWLKVYYPKEFYAAALSVLSEEKYPGLVADLNEKGLDVVAPDINISGTTFEAHGDALYAPFQTIKGCSSRGAQAILNAREKAAGSFSDYDQFEELVDKRICNVRVREALDLVGAFASIDPSQVPATDVSRLKDQKRLLPGIVIKNVKSDRGLDLSQENVELIASTATSLPACTKCSLSGNPHVVPFIGSKARVMLVMDSPNWKEEKNGKMMKNDSQEYVEKAMKIAGIKRSEVMVTSLIRACKPKESGITNEMINGCSPYLDKEIEILNPAIIVALGGASIRHLYPEARGGWQELCGQSHYDPETNRTIIFGMNPSMIFFNESRLSNLIEVFRQVKEII